MPTGTKSRSRDEKGRRVDHAVIDRDADTAKTYETTGENVDKTLASRKKKRAYWAAENIWDKKQES